MNAPRISCICRGVMADFRLFEVFWTDGPLARNHLPRAFVRDLGGVIMKRKGLIFALCAMAGGLAFVGCADDGNDKPKEIVKLTVTPSSTQLSQGDSEKITATYAANTAIEFSSSDTSCVSVSVSKATTNAEGSVDFDVKADGVDCDAVVTVKAGAATGTVNVKVLADDVPTIKFDKNSVSLKGGEAGSNTAFYKDSDKEPIVGKDLTASSSNVNCATAMIDAATNADGEATINIFSLNVTADCTTTVTVTGDGVSNSFDVKVTAEVIDVPDASDPKLEFMMPEMSIANGSISEVSVSYFDGDNTKPLTGYIVTIASSDSSCVQYVNGASNKTDAKGVMTGKVKAMKSDCEAKLVATQGNAKAEMTVKVTEKDEIALKSVRVNASKKYDKMAKAYIYIPSSENQTCEAMLADYKTYADKDLATANSNADGSNPLVHAFTPAEVEAISSISLANTKGILAFATSVDADGFPGDVVGLGCSDVSLSNDGAALDIELVPMPTNIIGEYDLVTNFDLTSAFPRSGKELPAVEAMVAGDWVGFIGDLFENPLEALLDFVWVNTVSRLKTVVDGADGLIKTILNFIVGDSTKKLAIGALTPIIEDALKSKDGSRNWYDIITMVSPDVTDLLRNMQYVGTMSITGVDADGITINAAKENFNKLQYQWSYKAEGATEPNGCDKTAYGVTTNASGSSTCHVPMNLGKNAIEGTWTGIVSDATDASYGDGLLNIQSHALTFKWATILYSAVFGEILPKALGYEDLPAVKNGRYITAFLSKLVFQPIVNNYKETKAGKNVDGKDYPNLSITGTGKDCEQFIESLVYLIYAEASSAAGVISMVADLACGEQALGQLDKLVEKSLSNIESSSENTLQLKAENCDLYDDGTTNYTKMGKPDEACYSAYDVFTTGSKAETLRCEWNVVLPASITGNPIKGLFHATRKDN